MAEIKSIIEEIDIRFKLRALQEAKIELENLDNQILKLQQDALKLDSGSKQFAKLTSEIGNLAKQREALKKTVDNAPPLINPDDKKKVDDATKSFEKLNAAARKKIETEFNLRAVEEAKKRYEELDRTILKLKADAASAPKGSAQFASITGQLGTLTQEKNQLGGLIKSGNITGQASGITSALSGITSGAGLAGKALGALGVAFGAFQVVNFLKNAVEAAAKIESLAKSFESFGIETNAAFELANKVDNLTAKVPFEEDQVNASAKALIKFNIAAGEIPKTIEELAAIAKGADFSLEALTDTFGRARKNGVVFGWDFLQVYKNIPGIVDSIAKSTGKTNDQIIKLGKSGKLSFDLFNSAIKDVTSNTGKYGQVLKNYQESFEGVLKSTKEQFGDILEETGKELLPSIKEGLKGLQEIAKSLIPVLKILGQVIGATFSAVGNFLSGISQAPGKLKEFFKAVEEGRVSFGGRFLKIDERKGTTQLTAELSKVVDDTLANIDKKITGIEGDNKLNLLQRLFNKKPKTELTDEQKDALTELTGKVQKFIGTLAKQSIDFNIEFNSKTDQDKAIAKIKEDGRAKVEALRQSFKDLQAEAAKAQETQGVSINLKPAKLLIDKRIEETNTEIDIALRKIETSPVIELKPAFEVNKETLERQKNDLAKFIDQFFPKQKDGKPLVSVDALLELGFDVSLIDKAKTIEDINRLTKEISDAFVKGLDNAKSNAKERLDSLVSELKVSTAKGIREFKASQPQAQGKSFLASLLGVEDDEKGKELQKLFTDSLSTFAEQATAAADTFIQAELSKTDFLINETENRLNKLLEVQESGNVDQINLEQERLNELNKQRQDFLEKQDELNKIQILGNNAVAISEGILAVTKAFGSGGNLLVGIATSLALAATVAATIASLTTNLNSIPKLFEGTESVGSAASKMKPYFNTGKDDYISRLDQGERVLPKKLNKGTEHITNEKFVEYVKKGIQSEKNVVNEKNITFIKRENDIKDLINKGLVFKTTFKNGEHLTDSKANNITESKVSVVGIPQVKDMGVNPIHLVVNTEKMESELKKINKTLSEIKAKETTNNINLKVVGNEDEKLRLKKLAR